MRKSLLIMAAAATLGAGGVARAQPLGAVRGFHEHDGFFLQMDLGAGPMSSKASSGGIDVELSGTAAQFSLAIGGVVAPNFIIAGHLWGTSVSSPDVKVNGQSFGSVSDTTLSLSGIGVNLTYYFMPINIYISATPSIGALSVKQGGQTFDTKNGFAIRLAAGKEWWVSDNWGLGLNLQFAHSSNEDQGTNPPTWSTNFFGLALSATYN
jgi:hypothetical protein